MLNITENSALLETVRYMHTELKLCGKPKNALLPISDGLLLYVLSLLRDEKPVLPGASRTEWNKFISVLMPHKILPLLYWKIKHLTPELRPPKEITNQMLQRFLMSSHLSLKIEKQLGEIIETFDRDGISIRVLKGPALARIVYPSPATRPSGDIDILVCPEQMIQARETLSGMGYKCLEKRFETFRDFHCDEEFVHIKDPKNNIRVEIHWALNMFSNIKWKIDINEIASRSVEVETPDLSFKTLHPADNLIHAALHMLIRHPQDIRLIWIHDCAVLARYLTLTNGWKMLLESNKDREVSIILKIALKMAQIWYNLKVPPEFNNLILPSETSGQTNLAWSDPIKWVNNQILVFPSKLLFSDDLSLFNKVQRFFHIIFPHPDTIRMKYPPSHRWLLPFSYIRRWWNWFTKLISCTNEMRI
jgi:hypothetical protein